VSPTAQGPFAGAILIGTGLFLLTLAVYWPALRHDFIEQFDDNLYVTRNAYVQQGITPDGLRWALTASVAWNWHPLTVLSHMLDVELYGLNPWGHHFTNILLHAAAAVLLFVLLFRLTESMWASAFVAALFALHPMHVESVAWIAERKDVLSACLWFLTTLAYVHYTRAPSLPRKGAVIALCALGLTAKPMLVTVPFTLLLLDYWPLGRFHQTQPGESPSDKFLALITEKLPLFALSLAAAVVTLLVQHAQGATERANLLPVEARIANALVSYVAYIVKLVWLTDYALIYPHPETSLPLWQVLGSTLIIATVTAIVLWQASRRPHFIVGWLWYLGTLVPVIGIIQVGMQAMADRYSYIPSIGLFIMLVWGVAPLAKTHLGKPALTACGIVLLAALAIGTRFQLEHWRDSETILRHTIRVTKDNFFANYLLGTCLSEQGRFGEAENCFAEAHRVFPDSPLILQDLGKARLAQGRFAAAYECYEEIDGLVPGRPDVRYTMGTILEKMGKTEEAAKIFEEVIDEYRAALKARPDDAWSMFNLATALEHVGRRDEALPLYREALQLQPDLLPAREAEALLNTKTGQQ